MLVNVYSVHQETMAETLEATGICVDDCLPDASDEERAEVRATLRRDGRCWIGGGAAALFLLTRTD